MDSQILRHLFERATKRESTLKRNARISLLRWEYRRYVIYFDFNEMEFLQSSECFKWYPAHGIRESIDLLLSYFSVK